MHLSLFWIQQRREHMRNAQESEIRDLHPRLTPSRRAVSQGCDWLYHSISTDRPPQSHQSERLRNTTSAFCKMFVVLNCHRLAASLQLRMKAKFLLTVLLSIVPYLLRQQPTTHLQLKGIYYTKKNLFEKLELLWDWTKRHLQRLAATIQSIHWAER